MASNETGPAALSDRFRKLGVVPYIGVAAKISTSSTSSSSSSGAMLFRRVPLRSRTGLPVPVDGDFLLNSTQDIIEGSNVSDKSDVNRAAWNRVLLNSLCKEYINLLESVKTRFKNPEQFYDLWPRYSNLCSAFKVYCIRSDLFYDRICESSRAMFLCKTKEAYEFRALDSAYICPKDLTEPVSLFLSQCYSFLRLPPDLSKDFQTLPVSTFPVIKKHLRILDSRSVRYVVFKNKNVFSLSFSLTCSTNLYVRHVGTCTLKTTRCSEISS